MAVVMAWRKIRHEYLSPMTAHPRRSTRAERLALGADKRAAAAEQRAKEAHVLPLAKRRA